MSVRGEQHPGFCGVHCRECEREEQYRAVGDRLECDRPRVAVLPARDGSEWIQCGTCERCRTGEPQ